MSIHWLHVLADASHDAMLAIDASGRVTFANHNASDLLGHSRDELLGRPIVDLFLFEHQQALALQRALSEKRRHMGIYGRLQRRGGDWLPVRVNIVPLPDDAPEPGALLAFRPSPDRGADQDGYQPGHSFEPSGDNGIYFNRDGADWPELPTSSAKKNVLSVAAKASEAPDIQEWVRRCREALAADRFVLHRQAVIDIKTRAVVAWELLVRMRDPDGRLIMPGEFLPACEQSGLIRELDRWVIRKAFQLLAASRELQRESTTLHINVSRRTLSDPGLLEFVRQQLSATGIDPRRIVFEVTETAAIDDLNQASEFMRCMQELGFRFALDDFGVGFTGIGFLRQLPVQYLKIDGSFIRDLRNDPINQQLVKAIIEGARALGKQTVAEFIPDEETLALLREVGADFGQGFYIGSPEPIPAPES